MLRRVGPVLAGAAVAVALLGACSGSDGSTANSHTTSPTSSPTTSSAAAPSTTTTSTPDTTVPTASVDDFSARDPFQPQG